MTGLFLLRNKHWMMTKDNPSSVISAFGRQAEKLPYPISSFKGHSGGLWGECSMNPLLERAG
jgi:hypothetical protein